MVNGRVSRDPVDPGLELDLRLGLTNTTQRGHEGLLRHLLRAAAIPDDSAHIPSHRPVVAAIQLLEGVVVLGSCGPHQLDIASGPCRPRRRLHPAHRLADPPAPTHPLCAARSVPLSIPVYPRVRPPTPEWVIQSEKTLQRRPRPVDFKAPQSARTRSSTWRST